MKQKAFLGLTCILVVFGCSCGTISFPISSGPLKTIPLSDELGTLQIELSPDFDTAYTWADYSDYRGVVNRYYRLQPAILGFEEDPVKLLKKDSIFDLTITHSLYISCPEVQVSAYDLRLDLLKRKLLQLNPKLTILNSQLKTINGKKFLLLETEEPTNKGTKLYSLHGFVNYKHSDLDLNIHQSGTNEVAFLEKAMLAMNSVKLD